MARNRGQHTLLGIGEAAAAVNLQGGHMRVPLTPSTSARKS
jgi:hypothetical protein